MYRIVQQTLPTSLYQQSIEQLEAIHLGFEVITEKGMKARHFGIHYHNRHRNALLAQLGTLIGHGYCQIITAMIL